MGEQGSVMNCSVCKKLGNQQEMVGLNGLFSHVTCFSQALSKTLKPLKEAMKKAGIVAPKEA